MLWISITMLSLSAGYPRIWMRYRRGVCSPSPLYAYLFLVVEDISMLPSIDIYYLEVAHHLPYLRSRHEYSHTDTV